MGERWWVRRRRVRREGGGVGRGGEEVSGEQSHPMVSMSMLERGMQTIFICSTVRRNLHTHTCDIPHVSMT